MFQAFLFTNNGELFFTAAKTLISGMSNSILPLLVCPITKQNLFLLKGEKAKLLSAALEKGELRYMDGSNLSPQLGQVQFLITENDHHLYSIIDGIPVLLESRQIDMQSLQI